VDYYKAENKDLFVVVRHLNLEMMPGIVAVTLGIGITTWLLLRLMNSIVFNLQENTAERKLILMTFFVILICYCIRFAGSIIVHFLFPSILKLYVQHQVHYQIFATCYWVLVDFLPIFFLFCVHYRNFSI